MTSAAAKASRPEPQGTAKYNPDFVAQVVAAIPGHGERGVTYRDIPVTFGAPHTVNIVLRALVREGRAVSTLGENIQRQPIRIYRRAPEMAANRVTP
jgi:hypothetical protein